MKCALMISGLPGTMEYCFPSLKKHIIDVYHPDVFVCSGGDIGWRLIELYKPVKIEMYSQEEIDEKIKDRLPKYKNCETQPLKDLSVNWKSWRCSEMIKLHEEQNGKYDVIISTRPDVKIIHVDPIIDPEPNVLYAPRIDGLRGLPDERGLHYGGYSTQLCWGTSDVMHKLCQLYWMFDTLYDHYGVWHCEKMTKWLLDMYGISRKMVEIDLMIIRGTFNNLLSTDLKPLANFPEFYND